MRICASVRLAAEPPGHAVAAMETAPVQDTVAEMLAWWAEAGAAVTTTRTSAPKTRPTNRVIRCCHRRTDGP